MFQLRRPHESRAPCFFSLPWSDPDQQPPYPLGIKPCILPPMRPRGPSREIPQPRVIGKDPGTVHSLCCTGRRRLPRPLSELAVHSALRHWQQATPLRELWELRCHREWGGLGPNFQDSVLRVYAGIVANGSICVVGRVGAKGDASEMQTRVSTGVLGGCQQGHDPSPIFKLSRRVECEHTGYVQDKVVLKESRYPQIHPQHLFSSWLADRVPKGPTVPRLLSMTL